ncbi:MAG: hypothetical protein VST70_05255 [Nitrospirota bacterium]|nr:hypothetical protein [Nitrospirota bacterium]
MTLSETDFIVIPVSEEEVRMNPDLKGLWKIVNRWTGERINGYFSDDKEARKYLKEVFLKELNPMAPRPSPPPKPDLDDDDHSRGFKMR